MNIIFSCNASNSLNRMIDIASELGHTYVGSEHLLLALSSENNSIAKKLLDDKGVTYDKIREYVILISGTGERTYLKPTDITVRLNSIISECKIFSNESNKSIGTEHLLYLLIENKNCVANKIVGKLCKDISTLQTTLNRYISQNDEKNNIYPVSDNTKKISVDIKKHPALSQYTKDLTSPDNNFDPVIKRDNEIERIVRILSRRTKNNPALIGEPGVGKTAIIEELANRIIKKNVIDSLRNKTILSLDMSAMLAGAKYRGEFEERMKNIIKELTDNKDIILFIDEMHIIVGAGAAEGAIDASNILKPAISRGQLQIIGATTVSEYKKHIEKDSALERRFQPIYIEEPTVNDAKIILSGLKPRYEKYHKVEITESAISAACELSHRYINQRYLPDKAIDVIDEACSKKRLEATHLPSVLSELREDIDRCSQMLEKEIKQQNFSRAIEIKNKKNSYKYEYDKKYSEWTENKDNNKITEKDIIKIISEQTKIPEYRISNGNTIDTNNLKEILNERIIGQAEAINKICDRLSRITLEPKNSTKPISSFLFYGSSGVGKTETAKIIAENVFISDRSFIKLDMSEYKEPQSISKLIGAPPGYIGYDQGGMLCDRIRQNPYSLILFDEIEKAHPDVYSLLLQILDEGRLTDNHGRSALFKNTIIIMTSNAGNNQLDINKIGFASEEKKSDNSIGLINYFTPEFLNRIDCLVSFNKITYHDAIQIVKQKLNQLRIKVENMDISLVYNDSVCEIIANNIKLKEYGARDIERYIQNNIEVMLMKYILQRSTNEKSTVTITTNNNGELELKTE